MTMGLSAESGSRRTLRRTNLVRCLSLSCDLISRTSANVSSAAGRRIDGGKGLLYFVASSSATPALLMTNCTPFGSSRSTSPTNRNTSSLSDTSPCNACILPGPPCPCAAMAALIFSSRRETMYTFAPFETRAWVIIRPIPVAPPVMIAVMWDVSKRDARSKDGGGGGLAEYGLSDALDSTGRS